MSDPIVIGKQESVVLEVSLVLIDKKLFERSRVLRFLSGQRISFSSSAPLNMSSKRSKLSRPLNRKMDFGTGTCKSFMPNFRNVGFEERVLSNSFTSYQIYLFQYYIPK